MMEEEYSNVRAPQYLDFTESTSPQMSTPDFFDKVHKMHERKDAICESPFAENAENADPQHSLANDMMYLKVQEENIIKNTPIKVIISPPCRGREAVEQFTTCDKVLSEAMRKLDFCKRLPKMQDLSKIAQEPTTGFKTPNTTKLVKMSRSVGCHSLPHKGIMVRRQESRSARKVNKNPGTSSSAVKKQSVSLSLFKEGNRTQNAGSDEPCGSTDDKHNEIKCDNKETCDVKNRQEEEEDKEHNVNKTEETNEIHNITEGELDEESDFKDKSEESADDKQQQQQDEDGLQQSASSKSAQPAKVLTWKNHRRITMDGRRMSVSKKYVSMAEAVSRFQNATPKRFHTKSIKEHNVSNVVSRQTHLKPTIPISPALVTKNRTRPVKVLSREEKEMLELEEMKKHRIKANPIPRGVLARRTNVAIKSTSLNTQPAEILRSRSPLHKSHDVTTATTVVKIDADGIVAKREDISSFGVPSVTRSVTRVKPFSLETRSKDLQKKKEERLKNLQEAVAKPHKEFHARPAPKFSKPPTPAGTSQAGRKHQIVPRPFSFDERDKLLPKKKEQKMKELLEEEKRSRVFHANPAPVFKPMLRQEDSKATTAKAGSSHEDKCEDQKERPVAKNTTKSADCSDKSQKKAPLTKRASSFELYTDKRARERKEFEEKLRRKEMEEEAMRQEQQKRQEEHDRRMRAEMRKLAEVKARPMPTFRTPVIAKHTKPLTNPQSPAFASKRPKQQ